MVLGALAASMLLTFYLSQQKLTEDVLRHVCNPKLFIKILISSLLISHLTLLTMHQIQPFLWVGPSRKEWQAPSHTWHLTKRKGQQEYCCISTVAGWCCPVPVPPKLCTATLLHFTPVPRWSQWSPVWTWVCHCTLGQQHYTGGKHNSLPCRSRSKPSTILWK